MKHAINLYTASNELRFKSGSSPIEQIRNRTSAESSTSLEMTEALERKRNLEESLWNRETWLIVVESSVAALIVTAAFTGSIVLCLAMFKFRSLCNKTQNYHIIALAASDLLFTLICVTLGLAVVILGRWPFGETICQIQGSLTYCCSSFSLLNMTLIALNRYVKMVRPANVYQKIYTKNNVLLSIAACGIFSGVIIIPFFTQRFCFHPGVLTCLVCKKETTKERVLVLSAYLVLFAITYPVMVFCYYKVFRKVRAHFAQIADSNLHVDSMRSFKEEVKITKILFAVLVAFLVCWTPAFTFEILGTLRGEYKLQRQVYLIMSYTVAANCAINPVIYGLMQKQFRDAYRKVIKCKTST